MKKIFKYLLIFSLFNSGSVFAQMGMGKPEEITDMKKRKLIVLLQPENQKVIDKLNKRGHADLIPVYKKNVADYNASLKSVFTTNWPYEQEVIFKTWQELLDLYKTKTTDYAVVFVYQENYKVMAYDNGAPVSGVYAVPYLDWDYHSVVKADYDKDDKDFYNEATFMRLVLIEELKKQMPIAMTGLANIYPSISDLVAGIYGIEWYCDKREAGVGPLDMLKEMKTVSPKIKTETLLIRETDLSPKFPKANVKSAYPYKYKVVADSIMDRNIIDKTQGTAFIITVPSKSGDNIVYVQQVFDCETGDWMGSVMPSIAGVVGADYISGYTGVNLGAGRGRIDAKVFEKLLEQLNGK